MSSSLDWKPVAIRDVTLKTRTWNPITEPRETITYVDVSAVSRETLEIDGADQIPAATAPSRARKLVKTGDTIFATIRPTLKRVALVPSSCDDQLASTAFCILRPDRKLADPDFLFFAASNDAFVDEVAGFETGASYPAVRDSDIFDREILLPPLGEQQQIANALHAVRASMLHQIGSIRVAQNLKRAAMATLC
jgi:type I restriction enzyme, S subunit